MVHFKTFQVFNCGFILTIKRSRMNVGPHSTPFGRRALEQGMDGEVGQ